MIITFYDFRTIRCRIPFTFSLSFNTSYSISSFIPVFYLRTCQKRSVHFSSTFLFYYNFVEQTSLFASIWWNLYHFFPIFRHKKVKSGFSISTFHHFYWLYSIYCHTFDESSLFGRISITFSWTSHHSSVEEISLYGGILITFFLQEAFIF